MAIFNKVGLLVILSGLLIGNVSAQTIFGKWKTIDDETGKPKSIVEIYEKDGKAYGKVIKLFREPGEDQDPICDKCTDDRKDKKVLGMEIVRNMQKDDDEWEDGTILDPKKGTVYDCKMWIEDGELQVRGYIAFFFRTQTWLPYK
jgi:uncharacterized protein (DUF2147 family)